MIDSRNEFHLLLESMNLTGIGVEVGVWKGDFSETLLQTTNLKLLLSIDAWDIQFMKVKWTQSDMDASYQTTINKLLPFGKRSAVLKMESGTAANLFGDCVFDFIYIDAGHQYANVKRDLSLWWPKLKPGGLFAGHDYFVRPTASLADWRVIEAVQEHAKQYQLDIKLTKEMMPSWYCVKSMLKILC